MNWKDRIVKMSQCLTIDLKIGYNDNKNPSKFRSFPVFKIKSQLSNLYANTNAQVIEVILNNEITTGGFIIYQDLF